MPTLNSRTSWIGISAGFSAIFGLLIEHRADLVLANGILASFKNDELRVILRPTRIYGTLLDESFHPDLLRDAVDRDLHFDRLWFAVEGDPAMTRVIPYEQRALQNGDIPFFTTRANSVDLWASAHERIEKFFTESGLAAADRRLRRFHSEDLERHLWIIRASLAASARKMGSPHPQLRPQAGMAPSDLVAAACDIGERLDRLAMRSDDTADWLGFTLEEGGWEVRSLGLDLYDGLPGIALFLAYLGAMSGQQRYVGLARATCTTMRRMLANPGGGWTLLGGFAGWGGVIYALTHLGVLWNEPGLFDEADRIVDRLPAWIEQDEQLDVMSGVAGCIGGLLAFYDQSRAASTLTAAVACGDRLIAKAQRDGECCRWHIPGLGPLAGFSHGSSGIAWALLELFARTGAERFRETALAAIRHERLLFSSDAGNWRDLRVRSHMSFPVAWCHGAPGIGLSRCAALRCFDDHGSDRKSPPP